MRSEVVFDKREWNRGVKRLIEDVSKKIIHDVVMHYIQELKQKGNTSTAVVMSQNLPSFRLGVFGGIPHSKSPDVPRNRVILKYHQQNGEAGELPIEIDFK